MSNINAVDGILNSRGYDILKPVIPVRLPYPTIGGTATVNVKSFEVIDKTTLYLYLNLKIYHANSDIFKEVLELNKKVDGFVYGLMKSGNKDLVKSLGDRWPAFDYSHDKKQANGKELLEIIKDRNIEHIFIKQDNILIPIEKISLGFDWDRNKLFFGTQAVYTCSEDILKQHIEVLKEFIEKASKIKQSSKPKI